jgi:large subunit ribosomal protein L37Ae
MATKKVGSAGRFGVRYGKRIRSEVMTVEKKSKQKQKCPYCKRLTAKRMAKGIWHCKKCKKKFTGGAYFLEA